MIKRKVYFMSRESTSPNEYIIVPANYDDFPWSVKEGGSYNVAPCRVLGLTYPNYLRMLIQMFPDDVKVRGKNEMYPVAYWKKGKVLQEFLRMLNLKMSLAVSIMEENNVPENNE